MALMTYDSQVAFAKRWLKQGLCDRAGTWRKGMAWGHMWHGVWGNWIICFETIGDGPLMVPGSFRVRCRGS